MCGRQQVHKVSTIHFSQSSTCSLLFINPDKTLLSLYRAIVLNETRFEDTILFLRNSDVKDSESACAVTNGGNNGYD